MWARRLARKTGLQCPLFFVCGVACCWGAISESKLTVLRPVAIGSDYFSDYPAGTSHRILALLSTNQTRAVFSERIQENLKDRD